MFDKHYIGRDVVGAENNGLYKPVSRVTLMLDNENALTAGDDTGLEIVADCPHATQGMVDSLLDTLKGYTYQAYTADAANLNPAAERGDAATIDGMYGIIATMSEDGNGFPDISAPGELELEDEYPSAGPMTREFNRKISQTQSFITKTADQIMLKVESTDGKVSEVSQKVDSITLSVDNNEKSSTIGLTVDGVEISSETIRFTGDVVFESDLAEGTTEISGDCITTGTIDAQRIRLTDEMSIYTEDMSNNYDEQGSFGAYSGWATDEDGGLVRTFGVGIMALSGGQLMCTDGGIWCGYENDSGLSAYPAGVTILGNEIVLDGTVLENAASVTSSDRNLKRDIEYDMTGRLDVLYRLRPCTYRRTDGHRMHSGLIAQEVEDARNAVGISAEDYAALCVDRKGMYGIRYTEFIPELIAAVQDINKRLGALEG